MKWLNKCAKIPLVGVIKLENLLIDKYLAKYIVTKQIDDLVTIVSMFSDNIEDLEDNIYVRQNDILVKMLTNVTNNKKKKITFDELYKNINEEERELIENLDIDEKIMSNIEYSELLGIEYFDESVFMSLLESEIWNLSNSYNLRANDDYNKLLEFLNSIKSSIKSSEDKLVSLTNQYTFYIGHSEESLVPEYISLYGNKKYKIELLKGLLEKYNDTLKLKNKKEEVKGKKR